MWCVSDSPLPCVCQCVTWRWLLSDSPPTPWLPGGGAGLMTLPSSLPSFLVLIPRISAGHPFSAGFWSLLCTQGAPGLPEVAPLPGEPGIPYLSTSVGSAPRHKQPRKLLVSGLGHYSKVLLV